MFFARNPLDESHDRCLKSEGEAPTKFQVCDHRRWHPMVHHPCLYEQCGPCRMADGPDKYFDWDL